MPRTRPVSFAQSDLVTWAVTEADLKGQRELNGRCCADLAYEWCALRAAALSCDATAEMRKAQEDACLAYIQQLYSGRAAQMQAEQEAKGVVAGSILVLLAWFIVKQIAILVLRLILHELLRSPETLHCWQQQTVAIRDAARNCGDATQTP